VRTSVTEALAFASAEGKRARVHSLVEIKALPPTPNPAT